MVKIWDKDATYNKNDLVVYANQLWECKSNNTTSKPCSIGKPNPITKSGYIFPELDKDLIANTKWQKASY